MLLIASIILFFIVISMITYANWPSQNCNSGGCPPPPSASPCNSCNKPKNRCGCPQSSGCSFC